MKPIVKLHRYWQDENQSLSSATILDDKNRPVFASLMLERGWRNNEQGVSCIPKGTYKLVLEYSPRFKTKLWEIKGVPNRSETKFHSANYWYQLNGCIAPGIRPKHLDQDRYLDLTNSRQTLADFHKALEPYNEAILIITGEPNIF